MRSAKSKRQFTLLALVAALGVAVYLNWEYAKADTPFTVSDGAVQASATVPGSSAGGASGGQSADQYFEQARLTRSKTRDEALDTLQQALKNAALTEDEKVAVTKSLTSAINSITIESDIENLVKAKGFADCVAFIDGERINLTVKTGSEGLNKSEVAQLRDIILGKVSTEAKNISIVEVK